MYRPELVDSQKGKKNLAYRGYVYHHHSDSKNGQKIYWRCEIRSRCVARLTTNSDLDNIEVGLHFSLFIKF